MNFVDFSLGDELVNLFGNSFSPWNPIPGNIHAIPQQVFGRITSQSHEIFHIFSAIYGKAKSLAFMLASAIRRDFARALA